MFGTIGHARLRPGARGSLAPLLDDWLATIRPKVPGSFLNLVGHSAGDPDALVFMALAQDESTYRDLAALPEQDAWFHRFMELVEGDVTWEDVEMESAPA